MGAGELAREASELSSVLCMDGAREGMGETMQGAFGVGSSLGVQ